MVGKLHGISGQLTLILGPEGYQGKDSDLKSVFIEIDSQLVPFFIQSLSRQNKKLVLKLDGVNTVEQADLLKNSTVYLPSANIQVKTGISTGFDQYIGFSVTDLHKGVIGHLEEILTLAGQKLLKIKSPANSEILIPAREEFVSGIDSAKRKLELNTPEGLIDIYLK